MEKQKYRPRHKKEEEQNTPTYMVWLIKFRDTRKTVLGFLVTSLFILIHFVSIVCLEMDINGDILRNAEEYQHKIYLKSYTHVAPFAIGLITGWVLWRSKCKLRMNKYVVACGWLFSIGLILIFTLVNHDQNKIQDPKLFMKGWSHTGRVVYMTLRRPLFALAIGWIILACANGYGGPANSILSWDGWLPLSRLTYCTYLVHLVIIFFEHSAPEYMILNTSTSLAYHFLGYTVMSYIIGYLLAVFVEVPMLGLETVVLK